MDWNSFLARVWLTFPLPMRFTYWEGMLYAWFEVDDHDTGMRRWLKSAGLDVSRITNDWDALRAVRYWAQVTALHELDECLYYLNRRPFDPHINPPLPAT